MDTLRIVSRPLSRWMKTRNRRRFSPAQSVKKSLAHGKSVAFVIVNNETEPLEAKYRATHAVFMEMPSHSNVIFAMLGSLASGLWICTWRNTRSRLFSLLSLLRKFLSWQRNSQSRSEDRKKQNWDCHSDLLFTHINASPTQLICVQKTYSSNFTLLEPIPSSFS